GKRVVYWFSVKRGCEDGPLRPVAESACDVDMAGMAKVDKSRSPHMGQGFSLGKAHIFIVAACHDDGRKTEFMAWQRSKALETAVLAGHGLGVGRCNKEGTRHMSCRWTARQMCDERTAEA